MQQKSLIWLIIDLHPWPTKCRCTTLGKINFISSFQLIARLFFFGSMWLAVKRAGFWCWDEDADLEMNRVTADAQSDCHVDSQLLTCNVWMLILSAAEIFPMLSASDVNKTLRSETETFDFESCSRGDKRHSKIFWVETKTFDFWSKAETETLRTETKTFSRSYIQVNCRPLCFFKATMMVTSSVDALILYNWNKPHTNSWHYQQFTHHSFETRPRPSSRMRTVTYGPQSFAVSGPTVWNTLPSTLRVSTTMLGHFQRGLKTILFRLAYGTWLGAFVTV